MLNFEDVVMGVGQTTPITVTAYNNFATHFTRAQRYQPHVYALAQGMRSRPQLHRAVTALVRLEAVSREMLDRFAQASNSPELIRQLRHVYGIPVITTRTRKRRIADRDRSPGVYSLPPGMKSLCRAALKLVAEGAV